MPVPRIHSIILIMSLLVSTLCANAGTIKGSVQLQTGLLENPKPISPFARSRAGGDASHASQNQDASVVVFLEASPALAPLIPEEKPIMDQRNYTIYPHILPVSVGTTVRFPNSDFVYHNLFSLSNSKKFDLGRYPRGESRDVKFDREGEIKIYCDIHPTMSGVILVVPNRYFTGVGSDGTYVIHNVPAGTYTITAWHEQLSETSQTVTVPETGSVDKAEPAAKQVSSMPLPPERPPHLTVSERH